MNSDAIIRRSRCLFDVLFSFLLNLFLEVVFQSEYCYSFNAVVNLHNVFSNSHTDPHSHQQFSSNGFCWVCVVSLGIKTHSLWDPPFSASQVLGWQVCLSTACHCSYLTTILWVWGDVSLWFGLSFAALFMDPMPIWAFSCMELKVALRVSQLRIYSWQTLCHKLDILGVHKLSLPLFHFFQIAIL